MGYAFPLGVRMTRLLEHDNKKKKKKGRDTFKLKTRSNFIYQSTEANPLDVEGCTDVVCQQMAIYCPNDVESLKPTGLRGALNKTGRQQKQKEKRATGQTPSAGLTPPEGTAQVLPVRLIRPGPARQQKHQSRSS